MIIIQSDGLTAVISNSIAVGTVVGVLETRTKVCRMYTYAHPCGTLSAVLCSVQYGRECFPFGYV
jgi:hypothetical protein